MNSLPCLLCREPLEPCWDDQEQVQPNDGVVCTTRGNYGSRVLDNMSDESEVVFNICDACFVKAADAGLLGEYPPKGRRVHEFHVPLETRLWVESDSFEEYDKKLRDAGLDGIDVP